MHFVFKYKTPFVLDNSILLPLSGLLSVLTISNTSTGIYTLILLPALILLRMAPQNSNKGNVTLPTRRSFLKVLYNVCQIKKKQIILEQYYRLHVEGPKIAVCETTSETVFVLNSAFTTKDNYFQAALDDAIDAFNAILLDFGYTQQLQRYDPTTLQVQNILSGPQNKKHHFS